MQFGGSTFMELQEPGRAAANQAAFQVATALYESTAVAECKKQHATPGSVTFKITLDPQTHRFVSQASGSLADQPLGACVRRIVDETLAPFSLPPDATLGEPLPFIVQVP